MMTPALEKNLDGFDTDPRWKVMPFACNGPKPRSKSYSSRLIERQRPKQIQSETLFMQAR